MKRITLLLVVVLMLFFSFSIVLGQNSLSPVSEVTEKDWTIITIVLTDVLRCWMNTKTFWTAFILVKQ